MDDRAHAKGVADGAVFVFAVDFVFVVMLRDDDADDEGGIVFPGNEDRATAVAGEGCEIGEEGGMGFYGEEGRAGEDALPGDGKAGAIGFEALGEGEDEEGAADVNLGAFESWFGGEDIGREGGNLDGKWFGEGEDGDVLIFVSGPEGLIAVANGDGVIEAFERAVGHRFAEDEDRGFSLGAVEGMGGGDEVDGFVGLVVVEEEAG